jgi:acyl carrier protein
MSVEELFATMQKLIAEQFGLKPEEITMGSSFTDDLGADSVDLVELEMAMEDEFGLDQISEEELAQLVTVGDCVKYLAGKLN